MSKILRFLTCLFCIVFIGDAVFAAGYECPTYRKYTTCNEGYYLAHSYTGTSYSDIKYDSTPRAGNACRPCTDYDNHYNRPEGSYYCEGKTKAPVLTTVRIIYNLNGGSGTTPDDETCKEGQPCTLNDGATTTFYRAGYVFKGWALTSNATSGFTSYTFTVVDVVYAVWEPCGIGKYKPGSGTQAAAACSSCPDLPKGFAYDPDTGLTDITQCYALATNMAAVDADCRNMAWDMGLRVTLGSSSNWDALRTDPVPTGMSALAGTYVNPDMVADTAWKSINGFNADDLCLPCPDGTYNDGQTESGKVATECTACPGSTDPDLAALPVSTGGTGATSHRQCYKYIRLAEVDSNCVSGEVRYRCMTRIMENSINYEPYPIPAQDPALAPVAAPGHAVYLPNDTTKPSCIECAAGTYSAGGTVYSCSVCPQPTDGFEYVPTTGNTSLTACKQGLKNPADINEFCEAASGTTAEEFKIQCWAASDGTWGDCIRTGFPFDAKPGCYVGIPSQSQSMPIEDVVENICIQCKDGTYSIGGGASSCSACPALSTADERDGWKISSGGDGATSPQDCYAYLERYPTNCASGSFKRMLMGGGTGYYGSEWFELEPLTANPGYRVQFEDGQTTAPACVACDVGTFSPGGDVHSCSDCPEPTPGFKYLPTTGNTSLTACIQGIENAADVNKYCAASSEATEEFDIQCQATSDGTWGDCAIGNAWTAKPGSYVGIWKQEMPAEDVIENMCIQCGVGTYSEGGLINSCSECPDLPTGFAYASITGLKKKTQCLAAAANVGLLNENCRDEITSAPVRLVVGAEDDTDWTLYYTVPTTTSMIRANPGAYVNPEILTDGTWQPYSNFNADELCKLCQAGTYNGDMSQTVTSCTACPTGYDDNPETGLTSPDMCQISCPGGYYLAAANDATCSEVSPGYWAAEKIVNYGDTSTRTECASGLTTIGYGAGADEADDCGRVLHFGDDTLYLRSVKKTDHALHVGINGTVFYGNMGTDLTKGSLRIKLGDTTYSVYDDSM